MVQLWDTVNILPTLPAIGPILVEDLFGAGVAITMVLKSLEPGRYRDHQQFEAIRKLRVGFVNMYMSLQEGSACPRTVGGEKVKQFLTDSPTQSLWFERFCQGCLRCMGQEVHQDWAIPLTVIHALLEHIDKEWLDTTDPETRILVTSVGAYAIIAFCGSFQGSEIFLADLHGLRKYLAEHPRDPNAVCMIILLLGRFKGETGENYHLTPITAVTLTGLKVQEWGKRLVFVPEMQGRFRVLAFCSTGGNIAKSKTYELALMDRLFIIQEFLPNLLPTDVDICKELGISRSFRSGATSTAWVRGVTDRQVEMINRWRSFKNSKGTGLNLTCMITIQIFAS